MEPTDYKWGPYNPIYELAVESGLKFVETWSDLDSRNQVYYWWKGGKVPDELATRVEDDVDRFEEWFYEHKDKANENQSMLDLFNDYNWGTSEDDWRIFLGQHSLYNSQDYGEDADKLSARYTLEDKEYG
mmetsp:Transcript_22102/g.21307  ORF Transcript_22102/g.21307 Transcript_22102/m.21307 type:complete len:130 (-) Transcript_22102:51-440(-)